MTNTPLNHMIAIVAINLGLMALPGRSNALSYFVDTPYNYSYGGCSNGTDVPHYETPITYGLNSLGWSGTIFQTDSADPQDFIDSSRESIGLDQQYADGHDVAIFCGHGNTGTLWFSWPQDGECCAGACHNLSSSNILMGAANGAQAASTVIIACCYMNTAYGSLITGNHYEKQVMGFGSIASVDNNMVNNYYQATAGTSNIDAWLNAMEDRPGWFTGDNTTVVLSRGTSEINLAWNQLYCGLKRQNCVSGGGGGGLWSLDLHDHGCGGCNGC